MMAMTSTKKTSRKKTKRVTSHAVHVGSRNNLLGTSPDPALVELLSNETQGTKDTPPTFLFHTSLLVDLDDRVGLVVGIEDAVTSRFLSHGVDSPFANASQ